MRGRGVRGHVGVWGGILLFSPTVWAGSGGERRDTHRKTDTGPYTPMLHLPFSDLPLRDGETTIKIYIFLLLRGGLGEERKIVQKRLFSWETPRQ